MKRMGRAWRPIWWLAALVGAAVLVVSVFRGGTRYPLPLIVLGGLAVVVLWWLVRRWADRVRESALRAFVFPAGLARKVRQTYPHLDDDQTRMVIEGLRHFFDIARRADGRFVSMPSQAVDVAWHEFILFTRGYQQFCRQILSRFLHHTPAEHMETPVRAQEGLRRTWRLACVREGIDPKKPERLPLLFALDALLAIPDGFRYELDCAGSTTPGSYCAGGIGCGGSCGGSSDGGGGGDSAGADGGSDGGGGCGGGGCGGGD